MSDPLFASIRDEMLTQMLAEELVRGSADWSLAMSRIDAAEAAYFDMVALSAGSSLCEGCQKKRWERRIIATPRIQVEEERDQLRARIAELERITLFVREVAAANARIAEATKVDGEPDD